MLELLNKIPNMAWCYNLKTSVTEISSTLDGLISQFLSISDQTDFFFCRLVFLRTWTGILFFKIVEQVDVCIWG